MIPKILTALFACLMVWFFGGMFLLVYSSPYSAGTKIHQAEELLTVRLKSSQHVFHYALLNDGSEILREETFFRTFFVRPFVLFYEEPYYSIYRTGKMMDRTCKIALTRDGIFGKFTERCDVVAELSGDVVGLLCSGRDEVENEIRKIEGKVEEGQGKIERYRWLKNRRGNT